MTLANVTISSGTSNLATTAITNGTSNVTIASSGGNIAMATNGNTAVTIDTSQNVTIAQAIKLSYSANSNYSTDGALSNYSSTNGVYLNGNTAGWLRLAGDGTQASYIQITGATYSTSNQIQFITGGSQRATIDASGNLLVGTASQSNKEKFGVSQSNSTSEVAYLNATAGDYGYDVIKLRCARGSATTEYNFINCLQVSTAVFRVQANGNTQNTNNSYGSLSDIKLKENIVDATPKLADLMQVKVRNYNLKSDPTHKQLGVIAQELEQVFPAMVEESPDKDEEGNDLGTTTKGVKYSVFVPMLIKAMQEQQALITQLQADVAALQAKVGA